MLRQFTDQTRATIAGKYWYTFTLNRAYLDSSDYFVDIGVYTYYKKRFTEIGELNVV